MSEQINIALLQQRRDGIRQWLAEEAPYAASDQRHLDASTPERAYWHYGYQSALTDIIDLLTPTDQKTDSADTSK
jgi:hypothetical protein